jgi:putative ABC transport system permease protein
LTAVGTVLGVGAFVAVLGLTASATGQISQRFTVRAATEVRVEDTGGVDPANAGNSFPADADNRVRTINGVNAAGVYWVVGGGPPMPLSGGVATETTPSPVVAASPGLLVAVRATMAAGRTYDGFHDARADHVVVLGAALARQLGITDLAHQPAIRIDDVPFTVIGIVGDVERQPDLLFAALVPRRTAEQLWGSPDTGGRAAMLIDTQLGAAPVVADQVALALRPDAPDVFKVTPPPDPRTLRDEVHDDLGSLFLVLAAVSLVIGAVGIANTTMVAVMERVPEIGLRRALGARRRHIASQFLVESAALGTLGGLAGAAVGVLVVVGVAIARRWTPLLDPWVVLPAPALGTFVGLCAGLYPALRAARTEPVAALRR